MPEQIAIATKALLVGIGGTVALDLWAALLERIFKTPATNWGLVGRWVGHMEAGRFRYDAISKAPPVHGERAIGWTVHYAECVRGSRIGSALRTPIRSRRRSFSNILFSRESDAAQMDYK